MKLTEWRRRRIIRQEYVRLLEEGFRAEVRRQMQEQLMAGQACEPMDSRKSFQIVGLSMVPVLIVVCEAILLRR